jgi:L-fucose mutarotase
LLKTACLNTEILNVLSKCGHGDKVLITDGNYPIDSNTNKNTVKVYLNLTHGIPLVTDVLKVINETIQIEKLEVMVPGDEIQPPIFDDFKEIVSSVDCLEKLGRFEFYEACKEENVKLAIATGDQRIYANVLLTIGVVQQ